MTSQAPAQPRRRRPARLCVTSTATPTGRAPAPAGPRAHARGRRRAPPGCAAHRGRHRALAPTITRDQRRPRPLQRAHLAAAFGAPHRACIAALVTAAPPRDGYLGAMNPAAAAPALQCPGACAEPSGSRDAGQRATPPDAGDVADANDARRDAPTLPVCAPGELLVHRTTARAVLRCADDGGGRVGRRCYDDRAGRAPRAEGRCVAPCAGRGTARSEGCSFVAATTLNASLGRQEEGQSPSSSRSRGAPTGGQWRRRWTVAAV